MKYAYRLHSFFEEPTPEIRRCDHAECPNPGEFKAPKGRYRLREYFWFCLEHVRAYNEQWNYYEAHETFCASGNSPEFEHILRWKRPPWLLQRLYRYHDRFIDFSQNQEFSDMLGRMHKNTSASKARPFPEHSEESKALDLLNLGWPVEKSALKIRYIELVKRYHPDKNGGCPKSENKLKDINKAYELLKKLVF